MVLNDLQVNFYERSLELMRNSMEVERKDISQSFKVRHTEHHWDLLDPQVLDTKPGSTRGCP